MFFFDENIGLYIVKGLRGFGEEVIHITEIDELGAGTTDEVWLDYIGRHGWYLVTQDRWIRNRPAQRRALYEHSIGSFFLLGKDLDHWARILQVIRAWHKIKLHASSKPPPFAFNVRARGGGKLIRVNLP